MKLNNFLILFTIAGMIALGIISYHQEEGKEMEAPALILVFAFGVSTIAMIVWIAISASKQARQDDKISRGINREDHIEGYREQEDIGI